MDQKSDRWDVIFATLLSVVTVASRLPYRTRMLYNWDSVQFALALREYDVVKHQPHPPGYVLYVALGRRVFLVPCAARRPSRRMDRCRVPRARRRHAAVDRRPAAAAVDRRRARG